ncbi:hypothetical protein RT717_06780 [Imperialibacter roseus]|uniref:Uncharacterized protein n=1 Tax=Imperialibacter roseus TaxID=1324217 RepID=A0ABZ0IUB7_9BACT|nr:hypothetical protein [Imperialibacter roseus]WOK08341.1 hypothetical protein RT717_06780 [Imperialibacter roseus]
MNFQGSKDLGPAKKQYQKTLTYLLEVQRNFPGVYQKLAEVPQFEYEVEIYRHNKREGRKYLLTLKSLAKEYGLKAQIEENGLEFKRQLHPSIG